MDMSEFRKKIEGGKFCITCEISPPRGPNFSDFESKVKNLIGKVDAINITDNPMLSVRMSPVVASYLCLRSGAEPIMQMTCRDRNILAITSDLISAYSLGVRNVLVLRGDLPKDGKPQGVFELDVPGFLKVINDLNEGIDFRRNQINQRCDFFPGAALNPFDMNLRDNLLGKLESGAKFFQTQPVFDLSSLENFIKIVQEHKANVLVGVIIVASERTLEIVKSFAKGIYIPPKLEDGILKFEKKEDKEKFGIDFSLELIDNLKRSGAFSGAHIYSPANENLIIKLADKLIV